MLLIEYNPMTVATPHLAVTRALVPSHAVVDVPAERDCYWKALLAAWGVTGRRATSTTFAPGAKSRASHAGAGAGGPARARAGAGARAEYCV